MVDGFLALGASFFLSPQHRLRKRVNSSSLTHRAYSTVANPTVLPSRLALSSCVNQTPQSNFLTNSPGDTHIARFAPRSQSCFPDCRLNGLTSGESLAMPRSNALGPVREAQAVAGRSLA